MKYKTFSTQDEEGINKFLEVNNDFINTAGTFCFPDRICFLYIDDPRPTEEELQRNATIDKLGQTLTQLETEAALQEVEKRHANEEAAHGSNPMIAVDAATVMRAILRKIEVVKKVMAQVKEGSYKPSE